ncbi:hypothetical protein GQ457_04G004740 [Hibiscus cannabinus]
MAGRSRTNVPATVYKDFQARIDREEEQGAYLLAIHLPDFPKEQINVTYVDASRSIKVQAEKAMERNTRSRFNQEFPVPDNCIIDKIQASFRNGILTISMPKRIITQSQSQSQPLPLPSPKQITPPNPTPPPPSSSTSAVQKQRDQKLHSPPKPKTQPKPSSATPPKPIAEPKPPMMTTKPITEPRPPMVTPKAPKPITEPRPPMATPAAPKPITEPRPPMVTAPQIPKQQTKGKEVEALPPLKQREEIQRKVSAVAKQTEEEKAGGSTPTPEIVERKGETKDGLKDLVDEKAKDSVPEAANIPKASVKAGIVEMKPKEGGGFLEMAGMDKIMKTVKRLATDNAEDRQLLINIGVSVLVIVALGAYITYSYRSSGKARN